MNPALRCRKCHKPTRNRPAYCDGCSDTDRYLPVPRGRAAGYDTQWEKIREHVRRLHPTCESCGHIEKRMVVHHIHEVSDHPELRLDPDNLIHLCNSCHEILHGRMRVSFKHDYMRSMGIWHYDEVGPWHQGYPVGGFKAGLERLYASRKER